MENIKYYILIAKSSTIEQIIEGDRIQAQKLSRLKKNVSNKIYLYSIKTEEELTLKVGDLIPGTKEAWGDCLLIKRKGKLPEGDRSKFVDDTKEKKLLLVNYLKELNTDRIALAKELLEGFGNEELAYRVVYNSFKMYKARSFVLDFAQGMLILTGQNIDNDINPYDLLEKFKAAKFDRSMVIMLEDIIECQFTLAQNESKAWTKDAQTLLSAFYLFGKSLDFMIRISEDILTEAGFLNSKENQTVLDWYEAGAMVVWDPVGLFRSGIKKEEKEELLKTVKVKS